VGSLRRLFAPIAAIAAALSRDLDDPSRHSRRGNKRRMGRGDAGAMEDRCNARGGTSRRATKRGARHEVGAPGTGGRERKRALRARERSYRQQIRHPLERKDIA